MQQNARRLPRWLTTGLLAVLAVIIILIVRACLPETPSLTPACTSTADGERVLQAPAVIDRTTNAIDKQVIVSGERAAITPLLAALTDGAGQPITLTLLVDCDASEGPAAAGGERPAAAQTADPVVQLYATTATVSETVTAMNTAGAAAGVLADPNYLLDPSAVSPCGDPYTIGGSPYTIGGSPFTIGGSPFTIGGSSNVAPHPAANPTEFWRQWAFEEIALTQPADRVFKVPTTGEGVRVAVFDTSPYTDAGIPASPAGVAYTIQAASPSPLTIAVSHPKRYAQLAPAAALQPPPSDIREHGVFVSSLVHAVAPAAKLHLIRVLDENGCGDLMTLNSAVLDFMRYARSGPRGEPRLEKVVLNFSLGLHPPRTAVVPGPTPETAHSLSGLLARARRWGAVIVAAAGNEGAALSDQDPPGPQMPANLDSVIGVEAAAPDGQRACYANTGDLAAPGGDGGPLPASEFDNDGTNCGPLHSTCQDAACAYGVVGVLSTGKYAYWVGSSFATPLVSGTAALMLQIQPDGGRVTDLLGAAPRAQGNALPPALNVPVMVNQAP